MRRWIRRDEKHGESPRIDAFLEEVKEVCCRYGLVIAHEDTGGAFEIMDLDTADDNVVVWLQHAIDSTKAG